MFQRLIRIVLGMRRRPLIRQQQVLWSVAAFAVSPRIVKNRLSPLIGTSVDHANLFLDLFP